MNREELRDLIIEGKELIKKLNEVWRYVEDVEIREATETQHLICDACEEEEDEMEKKV